MADLATPSGFPVPTYEDRRSTIVSEWIDGYGTGSNTASDTVDGLIIDILTRMLQVLDARLNAAFLAHFFNTAVGQDLDSLLALFGPGSERFQDQGSVAEVTLYGKFGTTVLGGSEISTITDGHVYILDEQVILDDTALLVLVYGPSPTGTFVTITIDGVDYGPSIGITGSGLDIANGAAALLPPSDARIASVLTPYADVNGNGVLIVNMTDRFVASTVTDNATSNAFKGSKVLATSLEPGEIPGEAFSILRVDTPRAGWEGVVNLASATLGRLQETNPEYRIRHKKLLGQGGRATPLAMRAHLLTLKGVEEVAIFENKTIEDPDAAGRPSHSFEAVVLGGETLQIALEIYRYHPLGIETHGNVQVLVQYRDQVDRTIKFSRPQELFVWVDVEITPGEGFTESPTADIQEDVRGRIVEWGNGLGIGRDAYQVGAIQVVDIPGSQTIVVKFSTTISPALPKPPTSPLDIVVSELEILRFDPLRVSVQVLP